MVLILLIFSKLILASPFALQSLEDFSVARFEGQQVFIVFQPQCHACEKQMQDLKCLPSSISLNFLGAFSDEEKLRREWRKLKTRYQLQYKAYLVDENFKKLTNMSDSITPQILIMGQGNLKTLYGLQSCETIKSQLNY